MNGKYTCHYSVSVDKLKTFIGPPIYLLCDYLNIICLNYQLILPKMVIFLTILLVEMEWFKFYNCRSMSHILMETVKWDARYKYVGCKNTHLKGKNPNLYFYSFKKENQRCIWAAEYGVQKL